MKNQNFDGVEQRIHSAFSQIRVDTEGLKTKMENLQNTKPKRRKISFAAAIAAVLILTAITATVGATGIGLPQFLSRFNPAFGEFAIPPEYPAYDVQDGIRIEVIGAQQIGNVVLAYITMQDETGQNRMSLDTWPDMEIYRDGEAVSGGSSTRRLHYDSANNRVYFEKIIYGEVGVPRPDTLELVVSSILYMGGGNGQLQRIEVLLEDDVDDGNTNIGWRIQVNTSDAGEYITWSDIQAGDMYIENMVLTPMGITIEGRYWNARNMRIGFEIRGRRRNMRIHGSSGAFGADGFKVSHGVSSPIDVAAVTAVYINNVRIEVNQ